MEENKEITISEEEALAMQKADEEYEMLNNAQQAIYQFIANSQDCAIEFDLSTIYPALWTKIVAEAKTILEEMSKETANRFNNLLRIVIESERFNPVQKPEDRPIQSEEEKAQGRLFIDPIPLPEHRKNAMNCPNEKRIPLRSDIYDQENDTIEEILTEAYTRTKEELAINFGEEFLSDEDFEVFTSNVDNYQDIHEGIEDGIVSLMEIDGYLKDITDISNPQFAEALIWNVFEMPKELREKIEQYNEQMASMMSAKEAQPTEFALRDEIVNFMADASEEDLDTKDFIVSLIFTVVINNLEGLFAKDKDNEKYDEFGAAIISALSDNEAFIEAIKNRKISKEDRVEAIDKVKGALEAFTLNVPANFYAFQTLSMFFK